MKIISIKLIILTALCAQAFITQAQYQYAVPVDSGYPTLEQRISTAEKHIQQLHEQVNHLYSTLAAPKEVVETPKTKTCRVTDPFGRSYIGKGPTTIEAQHQAVSACSKSSLPQNCKLVACE